MWKLSVSAVLVSALTFGCEPTPVNADAGAEGGAGGMTGGSGGTGEPDSLPPARIPDAELPTPMPWIVIVDRTEGLGVGPSFGSDIDAVIWSCPDGTSGNAVAAVAEQNGEAEGTSTDPALGAPDGPCVPSTDCAAVTGALGWLALDPGVEDLTGCDVEVYEIQDGAMEQFEVRACPEGDLTLDCVTKGSGVDGETITVTF
ncbi:MAG: hypothetical protein ACE366_24085 [Bradymonadia bacterium]